MLLLRLLIKGLLALSAGIGMTTAADDLAEFLRSAAKWVEAGGNVQLFLGVTCAVFTAWVVLDFWKFWRTLKAKRASSAPSVPTVPDDTALREALEREATAKALSDRTDAEFRTAKYILNAGLGALFGFSSPPKNEKNREDQSAARESNDGEDVR